MPQKIIYIANIGNVPFYKKRDAKTIKIRISGSDIKVSMPTWVPYKVAVAYITNRSDWVLKNLKPKANLATGSRIGKQTILQLESTHSERFTSKFKNYELLIKIPDKYSFESTEAQNKILKYVTNALQIESEDTLLPIIRQKANKTGHNVNKIEIKNLKSRWGSCNSKNDLTFSLFLIQLPWYAIEYVIYHELAHTVHMNHSKDFWGEVSKFVPDYKEIRQEMKHYSPHIILQP